MALVKKQSVPRRDVSTLDVARKAGVSLVTVSRALNNSRLVSPATKELVLSTARELGYQPVVTQRSRTRLNTIVVGVLSRQLVGAFSSGLLAGVHSAVLNEGYQVNLVLAPETEDEQKNRDWLRKFDSANGPSGLVLHHAILQRVGIEFLAALEIPVVVAGLMPNSADQQLLVSTVGFDYRSGIRQALQHLLALGHRRIGYFEHPNIESPPSVRQQILCSELTTAEVPVNQDWMIRELQGPDHLAGKEAVQRLFGQRPPYPTAVICGSDQLAAGTIRAALGWGRECPRDISIIGHGDSAWPELCSPALTSVRQNSRDLGYHCGRKLIDIFKETGEELNDPTLVPVNLEVRESTSRISD